MEYLWPIIYLFTTIISSENVLGAEWNYIMGDEHGPDNWHSHFPSCGGDRQSPVDILLSGVVYNTSIPDIIYTGYGTVQANTYFELYNNGHAVGVNLHHEVGPSPDVIRISAGGLPGTYDLVGFHFHWGEDDSHGSEHHTDNTPYAAELHLVHMNNAYPNMTVAKGEPDGLAVLGVHMEVGSDDDHFGFSNFTNYLKHVKYEGNTTMIPTFAVEGILPEDRQSFYRYDGSLTTPECDEAVVWTMYKDSVKISHDQMAEFRKVLDVDMVPINNNYRPTQALNGRVIYSNFDMTTPGGKSRTEAFTALVVVTSLISAVFLFVSNLHAKKTLW